MLGFCILLLGCRGVISADGLEASITVVTPGTPLPDQIESEPDEDLKTD